MAATKVACQVVKQSLSVFKGPLNPTFEFEHVFYGMNEVVVFFLPKLHKMKSGIT